VTVQALAEQQGVTVTALRKIVQLGRFVLSVPALAYAIVEGYVEPPIWRTNAYFFSRKTVKGSDVKETLREAWLEGGVPLDEVPTDLNSYLLDKVAERFGIEFPGIVHEQVNSVETVDSAKEAE
jgi:hypothetical protein